MYYSSLSIGIGEIITGSLALKAALDLTKLDETIYLITKNENGLTFEPKYLGSKTGLPNNIWTSFFE